ncbi:ABC transporter ATP-binding protein [Microbulbifer yueqingensis]|uniref:ABC transporter ATP-binding protein n=1 Tax=Microbulbifer yueqingensis TaxID=658219 RepID=UPI001C317D3C|nr:ABC transporter ATP-binding protein [Microbulbifer yueqingensis]
MQISELECRYGDRVVLESVSLDLQEGEIGCLLGASGCGKTTLLHAIAGFQPIYRGSISLGGKVIADTGSALAPEKRQIGVVFQDYALFPHLSVAQNLAFGLRGLARDERRARIGEMLDLVGLRDYGDHYPHQLSGGQQQRVALARSLAPKPRLLLMDEPFSNLDTELRRRLAGEVRHILRETGTSALIVTHDRNEAFIAGDLIGVITDGRLRQWDTPEMVYGAPATTGVARIVSDGNLLRGKVIQPGLVDTELGQVEIEDTARPAGARVDIFVRSADLVTGEHHRSVAVQVLEKHFLGDDALYRFRLPGGRTIEASLDPQVNVAPGQDIFLRMERPLVFTPDAY